MSVVVYFAIFLENYVNESISMHRCNKKFTFISVRSVIFVVLTQSFI